MRRGVLCVLLAFLLLLPAYASEPAVFDQAEILSPEEANALDQWAGEIAEEFDFGIYIVTVPEMDGWDAYDYAESLYLENGFGRGSGKNGILLLLSMEYRDYALITHGSRGQEAFTTYGQDRMCENFLAEFRDDRWRSGFERFLEDCEDYLEAARSGAPVDAGTDPAAKWERLAIRMMVILVVSVLAAGITCGVFWSRMRSARRQTTADAYQSGGLKLT